MKEVSVEDCKTALHIAKSIRDAEIVHGAYPKLPRKPTARDFESLHVFKVSIEDKVFHITNNLYERSIRESGGMYLHVSPKFFVKVVHAVADELMRRDVEKRRSDIKNKIVDVGVDVGATIAASKFPGSILVNVIAFVGAKAIKWFMK